MPEVRNMRLTKNRERGAIREFFTLATAYAASVTL